MREQNTQSAISQLAAELMRLQAESDNARMNGERAAEIILKALAGETPIAESGSPHAN